MSESNTDQRSRVVRISAAPGHLAILNAAEFIILLPQVGLEDFRRRQETQYGCISRCQPVLRFGSPGG